MSQPKTTAELLRLRIAEYEATANVDATEEREERWLALNQIHAALLKVVEAARRVSAHSESCDWRPECECPNMWLKEALSELRKAVE